MHALRCLAFAASFFIFADPVAGATSSSSAKTTNGQDVLTVLSGDTSQIPIPTGSYLTYSSTITVSTLSSSPITTSAIVSTFTRSGSIQTTTLGCTTILGLSLSMVGNATNATSTSSSNSQTLLQGATQTSLSLNGTSNSTASSTASSARPTNTTPCNGWPEFCERKYGNITEVAAHNSPFVVPGNAASNQALPVTTQLNDGIRLLQGQMHFVNNTPHFCHTSCDILDAGPITEYLDTVYDWVSTHPYDVVTLILENGDYKPVELYVPFLESTGLIQYAYEPPYIPMGKDDWPTLAHLILTGKRVIFFMDYDANQTAVPWILDEFSQVWETPFDPTNQSFPCTVQRPPSLSDIDAKERLYLTNHNLNYEINILGESIDVPARPLLNVTNNVTGFGSLGVGAQACFDDWGFPPKFLNVDYYNVGNGSVFEVAAKWNNVTYNRTCCGTVTSDGVSSGQLIEYTAFLAAAVAILLTQTSLL